MTENGWPSCSFGDCDTNPIPGTTISIPLQRGIPNITMKAFAADIHAYVESLYNARGGSDEGGWTPTNSVATSNHLGGTAMDLNWFDHPMGVALAGWHGSDIIPGEQEPAIRALLDWYEGTIFWGNDWNSPKDSMHFQMGYGTNEDRDRCNDFIRRKIRQDGFSTYRRGGSPEGPDAAQVLAQAAGLSLARATEILPAVQSGLHEADCTNVNRSAMAVAQWGHESVSFKYTEEIASGAAYEGRIDLGNTQPGDGVRFKGRTWIQITGRAHYAEFSEWCFEQGLVPTRTYFVDHPTELADLRWAGVGAAWYWTVARPDINALSDSRDIETVSRRINGTNPNTGRANGIDDRIARYNAALAVGDALLQLLTGEDDPLSALTPDEQRELLDLSRQQSKYRRPSLSPLRWLDEGDVNTCAGFAWSADANIHVVLVEKLAVEYGDPQSVALLLNVESASRDQVKYHDREEDAKLARSILAKVGDEAKAAGKAWLDEHKAAA